MGAICSRNESCDDLFPRPFLSSQEVEKGTNRASSDGETTIPKCQILTWARCRRLWNGTRPKKYHRYTSSSMPAKVGYSPNPCSLLIRPESWQLATASKNRTAALDLRSRHIGQRTRRDFYLGDCASPSALRLVFLIPYIPEILIGRCACLSPSARTNKGAHYHLDEYPVTLEEATRRCREL
jgi:hypothetical protein